MKTNTKSMVYACLKTIGVAGFSGVVISAPNATKAFSKIFYKLLNKLDETETTRILRILKRQGLVQIDKGQGDSFKITITPAGAYRLQSEILDNITIPIMKKWDGHWRLVCYDIPVDKKTERYELTRHLNRLGFTMVQKSMWVHPHVCLEQIETLTEALMLSKWVSVLEVIKLDRQTTIKLLNRYQNIVKI